MMKCRKCKGKTQLYLCNQCQAWLRRQLLGLPTMVGYLEDAATGNTRLSNEQSRAGGFESRTPVFSDPASGLIAEIGSTVGQWATNTAIVHGFVVSPPVTLAAYRIARLWPRTATSGRHRSPACDRATPTWPAP